MGAACVAAVNVERRKKPGKFPDQAQPSFECDPSHIGGSALLTSSVPSDTKVEVQGTAEGAAFSRSELDRMVDLALLGIGELTSGQVRAVAHAS